MERKNILITGGCGFIGSNFIRRMYFKYPSYHIYNLDVLTYAGNPENLADIDEVENSLPPEKQRYHFFKGDICDPILLEELFSKHAFDGVFNFAAETHVDRSYFNVSDFVRTNIEGARLLMDMVRKHNVSRMVHISTDEVYGSTEDGEVDEDAPFRPSNPYAAAKAGADHLVQVYTKVYNVPVSIVRGANNYGTHQYPEKLIPLAISNFLEGKKIPVHGEGKHVRQWIHTEDFGNAIDLVFHEAVPKSIYNIAGEYYSNLEVLDFIAHHLDKHKEEYREHVADRPSADMRYAMNSAKIEKDLGWSRKHRFLESLPLVIEWYKNNQTWVEKIKAKKEYFNHYEKQSKAKYY